VAFVPSVFFEGWVKEGGGGGIDICIYTYICIYIYIYVHSHTYLYFCVYEYIEKTPSPLFVFSEGREEEDGVGGIDR